jgi:hypothetical protein
MKKLTSLVLAFLILALAMPQPAAANALPGFVFFVWQNVALGNASLWVFKADGTLCGIATMANVGAAGSSQLAFQTMMNYVLDAGPVAPGVPMPAGAGPQFGTWFTDNPSGSQCGLATGALTTYWISIN